MSQHCAITNCKRASRALCHCCQLNLCREHLNEHDDILNNQLNPYADEINELHNRVNHLNTNQFMDDIYAQLNDYRRRCQEEIDRFITQKQQELTQLIQRKIENQMQAIGEVKTVIRQHLDNQDATADDLKMISSTIQSVRREIDQIEQNSIDLNIHPLEIDDQLIEIIDESTKKNIDLTILRPPVHTIDRSSESPKPLAANSKVLLVNIDNQLCLLNHNMTIKESIPWQHGWIWDMCWSVTLSRFFLITRSEIFMLHDNAMVLEPVKTKEKYSFSSCTCSETSFYVATTEAGSPICEFSLTPSIQLINRYQPSDLCRADETIQDIVYHKATLAFIIENQTSRTKRMELRTAQTFESLWSLQFDLVDTLNNPYRLCLFNNNEWIVIDCKSKQLFHITKDGQMKSATPYAPVPYRCCQFGSNTLVISAKDNIHFHQI